MSAVKNELSIGNSSERLMAAGETFTGAGEDVLPYAQITVACFSDVGSAPDGLRYEFSTDNVNWDYSEPYTLVAGEAENVTLDPKARFFRVRFTNGAAPQAVLRLQVIYHHVITKSSAHPLGGSLSLDDDGELVRAVLTGPDGTNVGVGPGGELLVTGSLPPTTDAHSSVAPSVASVSFLAANSSRRGATIFNDSDEDLFVRLGTPASLTNFTVKMVPNAYYEVPFGYVGPIAGIWAIAGAGFARIVELT